MKTSIVSIIDMGTIQAEVPGLFGALHITSALLTSAAAVCAAIFLARSFRDKGVSGERSLRGIDAFTGRPPLIMTLFICGCMLAVLEVCKQLYLYFAVNNGNYDWWYFPFQLCTVPMYLCILLPFVHRVFRVIFVTFMCGYTLVSAVAAIIYPEDILRSGTVLTVHGFLWHGILLFISFLIIFCDAADSSAKGIYRAFILFAFLCGIAVLFNMAAEPQMEAARAAHPDMLHTSAAMFYLDPYNPSVQPLVGSIQKTAGIPAGLVLYSLAIAAVSSAVIRLSSVLVNRRQLA